jgi:ribosomal protein S4
MKSYKIYKDSNLITKEIYVKRSQLGKKRNNSTFNVKKVLKDRELDVSGTLLNIVFSSGFANSLCEAKHIILNGDIELNNKVVLIPGIKLKSGDIVRSNYNKTLLNYYNRR